MATTDTAKLVAVLEADIKSFVKGMDQAQKAFDQRANEIEKRQAAMQRRLEKGFSIAGSNAARGFTNALAAGLSLAALESFVSKVSTSVEEITKQSRALGLSTDAFQALSIAAEKASISQEDFSAGMDFFSKSLGSAQLKTTDFGKIMTKLGVDIHAGPEQAFYKSVDAINKIGNVQQRNAVVALAFGRSNVQMAGFIAQGSAALKAQAAQFKANGEIIDSDQIKKIDDLNVAWVDLKRQLGVIGAKTLTAFIADIEKFTGDIGSKEFQSSLKTFAAYMAQIAGFIATAAKFAPQIGGALVGARLGGMVGGGVGAVVGGVAGSALATGVAHDMYESSLSPTEKRIEEIHNRITGLNQEARSGLEILKDYLHVPRQKNSQELLRDKEVPQLQAELKSLEGQAKKTEKAVTAAKKPQGDDLGGSLQPRAPESAYAKAVRNLIDETAALKNQTGAYADNTEAKAKAETATRLLEAAQEDAAKKGGTVTDAQKKQIDDLSSAYARLASNREFSKDLDTEDQRIAKLHAEAQAANLTVAALAAMEERLQLIDDWHKAHGPGGIPVGDMAAINARSSQFGTETGNKAFADQSRSAQQQIEDLQNSIKTIGLYGGALATAQMRLELLTDAQRDGHILSDQELKDINDKAVAYGRLTQTQIDMQKTEADAAAVTDELRNGLTDTIAAGLTGFTSLKSAAASFVEELAQMILKLYVLGPLMKDLFGDPGTTGGGLLGGLLNSIFGGGTSYLNPANGLENVVVTPAKIPGFASGTDNAPGGLAFVGERGKELVNLPRGSQVIPHGQTLSMMRTMNAPRAVSHQQVTQLTFAPQIDARGAVEGTDVLISKRLQDAFPVFVAAATKQARREFPSNLRTTLRDRG